MSCRNDNLPELSYKESRLVSNTLSFDKDVTYNFSTKNELYNNTIWNDKSTKTRSTIEAPNNFISQLYTLLYQRGMKRIPWPIITVVIHATAAIRRKSRPNMESLSFLFQ